MEQCSRNLLIRRKYTPPEQPSPQEADWLEKVRRHTLTAEEVLRHYCAEVYVYAETGTLEETARRLGVDRLHRQKPA